MSICHCTSKSYLLAYLLTYLQDEDREDGAQQGAEIDERGGAALGREHVAALLLGANLRAQQSSARCNVCMCTYMHMLHIHARAHGVHARTHRVGACTC